MSRLALAVGGAIGTLLTVLAALALFVPALAATLPPLAGLVEIAGGLDVQTVLLGLGLAVSLAAGLVARTASRTRGNEDATADAFDDAIEMPPEAATARRRAVTGAALDATVDRAVVGDDDALADVRARLRSLAVDAHARAAGREVDAASAAVDAGDWTDDPVAAAFLADDGAVRQSIPSRLRLWLAPERERRRRVDRTLGAIRRTVEGPA